MNLTTLFDLSLTGRANRPALEYTTTDGQLRTLTFGDIELRANRMAHELVSRGLEAGDRLCVHLPNRVDVIDLFLACTRLGVIFVPMNVLYRERELRHIIADADPKAVVVLSMTEAAYPDDVQCWAIEELARAAAAEPTSRLSVPLDGDAPAAIIYTSGTTGVAKGAVLSHNALAANGINVVTCWHVTEADRYLAVLPLFHVHGLGNGLHAWLISGCRMRLVERFEHGAAVNMFAEFGPTLFFGVPTIYVRLIDPEIIPDDAARVIGLRARLFVSGSAPLAPHVLDAFRGRFGHTILERYGMSETLMIMTNPYEGERRAGSVGVPFPGVSVRLVADDGSLVTDHRVGEVQLRSPALFSSYWRRPDATLEAYSEGWFRTGDLATRSADSYYTLRGRKGDVIISGGFNIYPREIEELLLEHPRVREAVVVGVEDQIRGEVPVAYVVVDDGFDVGELSALCRDQLASFKLPRAFLRLESVPRTALGKVQKHLLPR